MAIINNHIENIAEGRKAKAPYNFVPLNDDNIIARDLEDRVDYDIYHDDLYTGFIEIELETLTETLLRRSSDSPDFFTIGDQVLIPGSSIRGMIRSLVEILSFGKFGNFEDKKLFFRGFADKTLGGEYRKAGLSDYNPRNRTSVYNCKAGLLTYNNRKFTIQPCGQPSQVTKNEVRQLFSQNQKSYATFTYEKIKNKYYVISGDMNNKRHDWCIDLNNKVGNPIAVKDSDIESYEQDINRDTKQLDLLKLARDGKEVPCFYIERGGSQIVFAHTPMMRLPYNYSIGDHIHDDHKDKNIYDFAELMFGCLRDELSNSVVGKLFFEDANLIPGQKDIYSLDKPMICKPLLEPKPTTFQNYLVQTSDNQANLFHYNKIGDKVAAIRGNKLYWHRTPDWKKEDQDMSKKGEYEALINPIKAGIKFKGKIRFENLKYVELGMLLLAIDLPDGHAHKIGMGKPYGLGSIRINSELFISDRYSRYINISAEITDIESSSDQIEEFKIHAISAILRTFENDEEAVDDEEAINEEKEEIKYTMDDFFKNKRIKELYRMLDFKNKPKNSQTRYMEIEHKTPDGRKNNEFRERPVLPLPTKV